MRDQDSQNTSSGEHIIVRDYHIFTDRFIKSLILEEKDSVPIREQILKRKFSPTEKAILLRVLCDNLLYSEISMYLDCSPYFRLTPPIRAPVTKLIAQTLSDCLVRPYILRRDNNQPF